MQVRTLLVVITMTLVAVEAATAQSVAKTLAEFGLTGTWATDCGQPASDHNYLTIFTVKSSGEVSRAYYDKPDHVYNNYKIVSAKRKAPDMLAFTQVWDFTGKPTNSAGDRVNVLLNMAHGKFQIISSQGSDGSYFVKNRKYPNSGNESPWQQRCSR